MVIPSEEDPLSQHLYQISQSTNSSTMKGILVPVSSSYSASSSPHPQRAPWKYTQITFHCSTSLTSIEQRMSDQLSMLPSFPIAHPVAPSAYDTIAQTRSEKSPGRVSTSAEGPVVLMTLCVIVGVMWYLTSTGVLHRQPRWH
jgi:hypothetical protein